MKRTALYISAIAFAATSASAGGLSSTIIETQQISATTSWAGGYIGLSYGQTDKSCVACDVAAATGAINDAVAYKHSALSTKAPNPVETPSVDLSLDGAGIFAGYRFDVGPFVVGPEVSTDGTLSAATAQIGLPMGNLLAYGFGGVADYDGTDGHVYGGGIDYRVTSSIAIGGSMTFGGFDAFETETAALRVRYSF